MESDSPFPYNVKLLDPAAGDGDGAGVLVGVLVGVGDNAGGDPEQSATLAHDPPVVSRSHEPKFGVQVELAQMFIPVSVTVPLL